MNELDKRRWSEEATPDDIYYCYRLLLGREPGEEGWKHWTQRLATERFTFAKLAAYFCKSREYVTSRRARGIRPVVLDGFELFVYEHDWDIGENIILTGHYEPHVTAFLKPRLREGMTFIDVGANIGYFTLLAAAQVGPSGRTIAIECNPKNCELLYMSLHRNGFDQVLVYPFAVSDAQKLMGFSWGFSNGFVDELAGDDEEAVIVPAVTLDSLLRHEPRVDIIKMDIEGSEAKAWQGMRQVIQKHRPMVLMEFFPALLEKISGVKAGEFLDEIFASGYTAAVIQPAPHEPLEAASPGAVIEAWRKQCEAVGDESKAYLDLALVRKGN
ncbi:MAG TPA: FkbM family methyltransferase [Pyrinomonadaceae bacterium]|jgi:FkbM family methyltransferase